MSEQLGEPNPQRHETPSGPARVWAIVPAAGVGRRIGGPKALLRLGEATFVEHVVASVTAGGVERALVVVNPQIADAVRAVVGDSAEIVVNDRPDSEMIESIQMGLAHVAATEKPNPGDGCLITPVDKPQIRGESVRRCVDAFRAAPDRIVIASRDGRRGHPIVVPWRLTDFVRSLPPTMGLNQLPRQHADRVMEVLCKEEGVVADIDTPEAFRAMRRLMVGDTP